MSHTYYVTYQYAGRHDSWGFGYVTLSLSQPITTVAHVSALIDMVKRHAELDKKPIITNWIELPGGAS